MKRKKEEERGRKRKKEEEVFQEKRRKRRIILEKELGEKIYSSILSSLDVKLVYQLIGINH